MHEKNPHREYEAIITRVKNFGVYFEIIELLLEGFIHISELEEDYFVYEDDRMRLRGTRRGSIYSPGNNLTVMLRDVDFVSQETKWYIVANERSTEIQEIAKTHKKLSPPASKPKAAPKKKGREPKKEKKGAPVNKKGSRRKK